MRINISGGLLETAPNEKVLEAIGAHLENPNPQPAVPRYASTVMLVRNSAPGQTNYRIEDGQMPPDFPTNQNVEVFMLRRVKSMAFVPDAVVFPGGRVDEKDANPDLPWAGPSPAEWAEYMNVPEDVARCVVVAAAREVFEECGVLLASPQGGQDSVSPQGGEVSARLHDNQVLASQQGGESSATQPVMAAQSASPAALAQTIAPTRSAATIDLSDPDLQEGLQSDRQALVNHELSFADMLIRRGLVLRSDLLGLVSNWCTPEFEPRRYDTFFFSALMPENQQADDKTSESQISDWVTPAYAVRESDAGRWLVVPPTMYNLTAIAQASSAEDFVAQRRRVQKIMLKPVRKEDAKIVLQCQLSAR